MPVQRTGKHVEKRLSPRERTEPEAIRRLRSEALLLERLGRLAEPPTPMFLARGEDAEGPWHRVATVSFPTLAERLSVGPIDAGWVERAVGPAFAALAALHEAADDAGPLAIVHGDPSPGNLAIDDAAERAVLLDLDLACWREHALPADGSFRGTIAYVAPELARGEAPTTASDLFALAAALLHATLGRAPRVGSSLPALLAAAAEEPLLGTIAPEVLARGSGHRALASCLAHDARERPATARAVVLLARG